MLSPAKTRRSRNLLALLFITCALFRSSPASVAPICRPTELTTEFGEWADEGIVVRRRSPHQPVTPLPQSKPAIAMRLLLSAQTGDNTPWSVTIHDSRGHLLALIDREDFQSSGGTVWTGRLAGPRVTVSLRGGNDATEVEIRGSVAMPQPEPDQAAFSISGSVPNWAPLYPQNEPLLRQAGETVGMLVNMRSRAGTNGAVIGHDSWCCSGVMIGKDLFLTNWHCGGGSGDAAWSGEVVPNALVDLAWEDGPVRRQFSVSKVEASDEGLDFAILRLKPIPGVEGGIRRALPVSRARIDPVADQEIFMIHHAQCLPKRISSRCRIKDAARAGWIDGSDNPAATEITHDCDTEPGASGAAIFDAGGALLALHHLGFQKGPQCPADRLNKAVKISAIASFLQSRLPRLARELGW